MKCKSSDLFGYALLTLIFQHFNGKVDGSGVCKDLEGHTYDSGFYYIHEPCTLCVCDNGNPKWCRVVLCSHSQKSTPKQDCKSLRIGTPCCEFICLDDTLSSGSNEKTDGIENGNDNNGSYDLGLRLIASCITAVLSLSLLFFLIHRLRQRKIRAGRQNHHLADEQRNLGSMGYLDHGGLQHEVQLDEMACSVGYPLWKPPGHYFPHGEAPPPYEEAVAAARAEQALLTISPHTLSPLNLPNSYLTTNSNMILIAANQNNLSANSPTLSHYNAAASPSSSISSANRPHNSANNSQSSMCHQQIVNNDMNNSTGLYSGTTAATLETNICEREHPVPPVQQQQQQQNLAVDNDAKMDSYYQDSLRHKTFPRQTSAFTISATLPSSGSLSSHRTIPRSLIANTNFKLQNDFKLHIPIISHYKNTNNVETSTSAPVSITASTLPPPPPPPTATKYVNTTLTTSDNNLTPIPSSSSVGIYDNIDPIQHQVATTAAESLVKLESENVEINAAYKKPPHPAISSSNPNNESGSFDSVTCTCSTQALPTLHDDADDYRSECENCKSANGSRYYLDNENELVTSPSTMTLHRRPEDAVANVTPQYYRTSLTLPTNTRQRIRSTSARDNWFNSMPESSTESSEED